MWKFLEKLFGIESAGSSPGRSPKKYRPRIISETTTESKLDLEESIVQTLTETIPSWKEKELARATTNKNTSDQLEYYPSWQEKEAARAAAEKQQSTTSNKDDSDKNSSGVGSPPILAKKRSLFDLIDPKININRERAREKSRDYNEDNEKNNKRNAETAQRFARDELQRSFEEHLLERRTPPKNVPPDYKTPPGPRMC